MPKYPNLQRREDTPILIELFEYDYYKPMFNPDLYVYVLHDTNTSGAGHIERLFDNAKELSFKMNREFKQKVGWL